MIDPADGKSNAEDRPLRLRRPVNRPFKAPIERGVRLGFREQADENANGE